MAKSEPSRFFGITLSAYVAFAVATLATSVAWIISGANLGLLFAGTVLALIIIAPMALAESGLIDRLIITGAAVDGIAIAWLIASFLSSITLVQWLLCYALLIAWALAVLGATHFLDRITRNPVLASAMVVALGLGWLASPIWLKMRAPAVVPVHPLMVFNGIVPQFGLWTERPIAYRYLFNLGQDVPYELPHSVAAAVFVHAGVGLVAVLVSGLPMRRNKPLNAGQL